MISIDIEKRPRRKHGFPSAIPRLAARKIQDRISSPTAKLVRIGKNQPNLSIEQTQGRCKYQTFPKIAQRVAWEVRNESRRPHTGPRTI